MKINMKKKVQVDAKVLKLHLKVCDCFTASIVDQDGEELVDYDDYVPAFMPGDHCGDYVILDIDLDSGQILNWKKIDPLEIQRFIEENNE